MGVKALKEITSELLLLYVENDERLRKETSVFSDISLLLKSFFVLS